MLDGPQKLTKYEMKIIREITDILSPFEAATAQCEGQNIITASLVIPCIRGIRAELQILSQTYKSKIVTTLQRSLETRLATFETSHHFKLASVLDPRWKMDWCTEEEAPEIKNVLKNIMATPAEATADIFTTSEEV